MPAREDDMITTRSLYLSAYLRLEGYSFVKFRMMNARDGEFIFRKDEGIGAAISKFYDSGNCFVEVQAYLGELKRLRDLVLGEKRRFPG